jgi:hypothetical protein
VQVFYGIDCAEDHYDVALVDQPGIVLTERRIDDDAIGYQVLLAVPWCGADQVRQGRRLAAGRQHSAHRPGRASALAS